MWTTILARVSEFLARFMEWYDRSTLLKLGRQEAELDALKRQAEDQEAIHAIETAPVPSDPVAVLGRL